MAFYAVARGRNPGLYRSWEECAKEVSGFPGADYKKFSQEKDALNYIQAHVSSMPSSSENSAASTLKSSVKRKLSPDSSVSSNNKVRLMERLKTVQDKIEVAINMFKDLASEVNSIKEELMSGTKTPRKAILIDIEDIPDSETDSLSPFLYTSGQDQHSSGANQSNTFKVDSEGYVEVYTDGACTGNGYSRAKAGVGVWFGAGHSLNASEPVKGRPTNNSAEIEAATLAILHAKGAGVEKLKVYTDSAFLINAITKWINNWKRNNWKTATGDPVKNKEELILLDKVKEGIEVKFEHVSGHSGVIGNEAADFLARAGAEKYGKKN